MRWIGSGSDLWRVRVDLFVEGDGPVEVQRCREALEQLLVDADGAADGSGVGVDQGTGVEGSAVVGQIFWVRGNDVGEVATLGVATATRAGRSLGIGPRLYDVVVIPRQAVVAPDDSTCPRLPD